MTWVISTSNLQRITSYEDAKEYYEKTKPLPSGRVPLGRRGDSSKYMEKAGDHYRFYFHQTAVVTYTPDEVYVKPWDSTSTVLFADRFLPPYAHALSHHGRMWVRVDTINGEEYYDNDIKIIPEGNGWRVDGKRKLDTEMILDKKKAAEVRKLLQPFKLWQTATAKLNPHALNKWPSHYDVSNFLDHPDNMLGYPALGRFEFDKLRPRAYERFGAYQDVPVPLNRLPKKDPI